MQMTSLVLVFQIAQRVATHTSGQWLVCQVAPLFRLLSSRPMQLTMITPALNNATILTFHMMSHINVYLNVLINTTMMSNSTCANFALLPVLLARVEPIAKVVCLGIIFNRVSVKPAAL